MPARPPTTDTEQRVTRIRRVIPPIGGVLHLVQAVIFFGMNRPVQAWISVAAVLVFVVCAELQRRGLWRQSLWLLWLETTLHPAWLTVSFGVETLYPLYWIAVSAGSFLVFTDRDPERLPAALLPAIGAPLLFFGSPAPLMPVAAPIVHALAAVNITGLATALVVVVAVAVWSTDAAETALMAERDRSRKLLHNVLPVSIATRLEQEPGPIADHMDGVAVLFADIVGFTKLAAERPPAQLIELLNDVFSRFDTHADRLGIEKIKTIGDAYMAVAGLPEAHPRAASAAVAMAEAMREVVAQVANETGSDLQIRVGIHYGPVVAGVIGSRKFAYDLWGDAVNVASRMESHGEPGRIQVTEAVVQAAPELTFEARGTIEVKGKGQMPTWWVSP
ncbi:MAG: adenylate/guanylate cyclase domain-containing protein [Proteobacteria bacterium]|nr:adenylate/guanylate cyclase domain-containing protein [Pseudomonadota bacterium]